MAQKWQFRNDYIDSHYCAVLFTYMREFALRFHDASMFASLDGKHQIKVGAPNYPIAAAERGEKSLVLETLYLRWGFSKF